MNMLNPKNRKKTMKTFKLFSMAALALAMAACSNEDSALENAAPAQQQGTMKFTATLAAPGSGATTRTTYTEVTEGDDAGKINVAWKAGDEIYLYDEGNGATCTATVGTPAASGSATISGTFSKQVEAGHSITATYPVSAVSDDFNAKFTSQAGTPAYIQDNLDYRIGTSTISVDGDQATLATALQMESQIAIWKLTLQNSSSEALSATKVTIKNGSTVIAATTDISATSAVYLALNLKSGNISGADITIEATVGSDTYTYSKSGVSLAKGNYYQSTLKMTKAPTIIKWTSSDFPSSSEGSEGPSSANSFAKYGITMSVSRTIDFGHMVFEGNGTFTSTVGNFTKIEVTAKAVDNMGDGWTVTGSFGNMKATWTGTASSTVNFGNGDSECVIIGEDVPVTMVFTLE
jgi:hypothetical protein